MSDNINNVNPIDLEDPKDSLAIEEDTNAVMSSNIYEIAKFIDKIKEKYIDIPNDVLTMGLYGYISELGTNIIENSAVISAEYANESSPTKAKFDRNVICHALSLGINKIRALPAVMTVHLGIPENRLIDNMVDNEFIIDKSTEIKIGNDDQFYSYMLDYDIKITRNKLPNGKIIYTATYLMGSTYSTGTVNTNEVSDITNPYLPVIGVINISDVNILQLTTVVRQMNRKVISKKIVTTNPLENKSIVFSFTDQLVYFYVEVLENTNSGLKSHYLRCVYDGLYNTEDNNEYCNYQYIDSNTIRITFNRNSYQPRITSDVNVYVFTTKGSECNFKYSDTTIVNMKSNKYNYDNIYMMVIPASDSEYGANRKNVEELHEIIPKQMLMRNSISTYKDIDNYFNLLNTDNIRIYFLQKIHNQLQRLFFGYLLMKDHMNNIIPTNTLDVNVTRDLFSNINSNSYILPPGTAFYIEKDKEVMEATGIHINNELEQNNELKARDSSGFLYINPFLVVINKNPFLTSYYLNILDYTKMVNFNYINDKSELQFICASTSANPIKVKKPFYPSTDRDNYTVEVLLTQNIPIDFGLIKLDDDSKTITENNIRVIGVIYNKNTEDEYKPYRYADAVLENGDYDVSSYSYTFKFKFHTNNIINKNTQICIDKGLKYIGTESEAITYLPSNVKFKIFILARLDKQYGTLQSDDEDHDDISELVPNLTGDKNKVGYTLCNIYEIQTGLDLFLDYSNIMESYTYIKKAQDGSIDFHIKRMPLLKYGYIWDFGLDSDDEKIVKRSPSGLESRLLTFIRELNYRRLYIQSSLALLEDSFGIDFKFFNTYGPSKIYCISDDRTNSIKSINRVNISLEFEVKWQSVADKSAKNDIILAIKKYIENINYLSDLYIPNLLTIIKNKFYKQIVYIKFVGLNDYGYVYQSIYKQTDNDNDYMYSLDVPEFININNIVDITGNVIPDINIVSVE